MSLKHFLIDGLYFHGTTKHYQSLSWAAPWNKEWRESWPNEPEDFYTSFKMHLDWYEGRSEDRPEHGACFVTCFGFYWICLQGYVELSKGPITAKSMYVPPQLEFLDVLFRGRFREVLYTRWKALCEKENATKLWEQALPTELQIDQ